MSPRHLVTLSRILCLALATFAITGCNGRSAPPPIWCGHIANWKEPEKQTSEAAKHGIALAVEEINRYTESTNGRLVKVIHCDAHGSLDAIESEAVRLVSINRVVSLLGGTNWAEIERLDRAGVPVLTPAGPSAKAASEGVYYTGLGAIQRGKVLAQFIAQELSVSALAVVVDDRQDAAAEEVESFAREFTAFWAKKDANVAPIVRRYRLSKDSKSSEVAKAIETAIAQDNLKTFVFAGKTDDLREFTALTVPMIITGNVVSAASLLAMRMGGKEFYFATPFVFGGTEATEGDVSRAIDFAKRYKKAFDEEPDVSSALAYEDMRLLYEALVRAKDTYTPVRMREELSKLKDVPGLVSPLSFTPERTLRRAVFVVRIDDSGVKTVKRYDPE